MGNNDDTKLKIEVTVEELLEATKRVGSVVDFLRINNTIEVTYNPEKSSEEIFVDFLTTNYPLQDETLKEHLHIVNYPQDIPLGIPTDTIWQYISVCYLNGIVNYVKPLQVLIHWDYTEGRPVELIDDVVNSFHTDYSHLDVNLLGETTDDYWIFCSNQDVSDCCVGRISKETSSIDEFIELAQKWWAPDGYNTEALPLPTGWITF